MARKPSKRISLAQNFLRSTRLVRRLLDTSSIESSDTVYEVGPGRGIITAELAQIARNVIAVEKDLALAQQLCRRFESVPNVQIIAKDFLRFDVPAREYKIFANIPYNITAGIVRKILHGYPAPREAYLILQKEAAEKFSGSPKETQFSILEKPWFDIRIMQELRKTDFEPAPAVDSVLLRIKKRYPGLIRSEDALLYRSFVRYGFGTWKSSLKLIFKPIFTYEQWKHLSRNLDFPLDATPTQLSFEQWLGLFACFQQRVPESKQAWINRVPRQENT